MTSAATKGHNLKSKKIPVLPKWCHKKSERRPAHMHFAHMFMRSFCTCNRTSHVCVRACTFATHPLIIVVSFPTNTCLLKFRFSEKITFVYWVNVKISGIFFSNFVAFSQYLNFIGILNHTGQYGFHKNMLLIEGSCGYALLMNCIVWGLPTYKIPYSFSNYQNIKFPFHNQSENP